MYNGILPDDIIFLLFKPQCIAAAVILRSPVRQVGRQQTYGMSAGQSIYINLLWKLGHTTGVGPIVYCYWVIIILTHWGQATHICINKLNLIGSDNGLSNGWRQAVIWIKTFILKINFKMSAVK